MADAPPTEWDEWFDAQYDINQLITKAVDVRSAGKGDKFKAAVYAGLLEHCAEELRYCLDLDDKTPLTTEQEKSDG